MHTPATTTDVLFDPHVWSVPLHILGWAALVGGLLGIGFGIFHAVMAFRERRDPDALSQRIRAGSVAFFSGVAIASIPSLVMIAPQVFRTVAAFSDEHADALWQTSIVVILVCIAINTGLLVSSKRR